MSDIQTEVGLLMEFHGYIQFAKDLAENISLYLARMLSLQQNPEVVSKFKLKSLRTLLNDKGGTICASQGAYIQLCHT